MPVFRRGGFRGGAGHSENIFLRFLFRFRFLRFGVGICAFVLHVTRGTGILVGAHVVPTDLRFFLVRAATEAGGELLFLDKVVQGRIPKNFIPAVEKGVIEALNQGVLAGYPVVDVKVALTFGSYHDVDSNENAFKMAASIAFKDGMRKANPVLLEPMMAVEVETPEDYAGTVMGDLSSRRGMVQGMDDVLGGKIIKAEVPLSEMFGYSTTLRSATQGRATYSMEFKHYSEAPKNVAEAVTKAKAG